MRKSGKTSDKKLENRTTDALFFVEGSAPARFATTHFQHFDGWDWTTVESNSASPRPAKIRLKKQNGKPVFSVSRSRAAYLTGSRIHRLKLMRLETNSLLMASCLDSWHIANVDKVDFFQWDEHGQIRFDGEFIPSQTVIDMKGLVPNYHAMRNQVDLQKTAMSASRSNGVKSSPYLQTPNSNPNSSLRSRVDEWTTGTDPGWDQVESIVAHLRNDFELNNSWEVDQSVESSIDHFLDHQGGPTYMFATTCAVALRHAGYKTRLASGFIVTDDDYDRLSKQSVVTSDNVHMWPEVCLDGRFWIPVEPTPGYPEPYNIETLWQRFVAKVFSVFRWIYQHPLLSITAVAGSIFLIAFRIRLITIGLLIWWHLVRLLWTPGLLTATRRLIDARFWAAGFARPTSRTIGSWYSQVDPNLSASFIELWNLRNFSETSLPVGNDEVVASCHEQVRSLTFQKIKSFQSENRMGAR